MTAELSTLKRSTLLKRYTLRSACLGDLEWEAASELFFPQGIPGFESEKRIVPIEIPAQRPLVYLHSACTPDVCFLALPAGGITPGFRLRLLPDDYQALDLEPGPEPVPGEDILCLALLGPSMPGPGMPEADGTGIQTNLAAPVVISLHNQRGHQLIPATGPEYWRLGENGCWEVLCL